MFVCFVVLCWWFVCLFGDVCFVAEHNGVPSSRDGVLFVVCFVGMFCNVFLKLVKLCVYIGNFGHNVMLVYGEMLGIFVVVGDIVVQ